MQLVFIAISAISIARGVGVEGRGLYALAIWWPLTFNVVLSCGQTQINEIYTGLYKNNRRFRYIS